MSSRGTLPEAVELQRTRMVCGAASNSHTAEVVSAHAYAACGFDNSFTMERFKEEFDISIVSSDESRLVFEMKGVSPAIANALRRILIAEVPTMAIEQVYVANNTSVIQDEVLAHRLGLIPIAADPALFLEKASDAAYNESNTIVFRLKVRCACDYEEAQMKVYSSDLQWKPNGSELPEDKEQKLTSFGRSQEELMSDQPIAPVHPDILVAKLRAGQEIDLEAHCIKGMGKQHAKWSPVSTAWYELVPECVLLQPVRGAHATAFMKVVAAGGCGCFDLRTVDGEQEVQVMQIRGCARCRERFRGLSGEVMADDVTRWDEYIQLRKIKDHFIFTIESTGIYPPERLFHEAVKILKDKCCGILGLL